MLRRSMIALAGLLLTSLSAFADKVILAEGQSNAYYCDAQVWTPSSNAKVWNWDGTPGHVGTAFVTINTYRPTSPASTNAACVNVMERRASEEADKTGETIYLVNISYPSQDITHWLPGTSAPDMYAALKANVEAALAMLGKSTVDEHDRWQGESDAQTPTLLTAYPANLNAYVARLRGETWYPFNTPMLIVGIDSTAHVANTVPNYTGYDGLNLALLDFADAAPLFRKVVPASMWPPSFWTSDGVHMVADGRMQLGTTLARVAMHGGGAGMSTSSTGTGPLMRADSAVTTGIKFSDRTNAIPGPSIFSNGFLVLAGGVNGFQFNDAPNLTALCYMSSNGTTHSLPCWGF